MKNKHLRLTVKDEFNNALENRNNKIIRGNLIIEKTKQLITEFEDVFEMHSYSKDWHNHIMFHDEVVSLHVAGCLPRDVKIRMIELGLQEKRNMNCFSHYGIEYPDTLWLELVE